MKNLLLLYALVFCIILFAVYQLCTALFLREPFFLHGTKLLKKVAHQESKRKDLWQLRSLNSILQFLGTHIYLEESQKKRLNSQLLRLNLPYTAETYIARGYCGAGIGLLLTVLSVVAGYPLFGVFGVLIGVYLYLRNKDLVSDQIKARNEQIIKELPQFVDAITVSLEGKRDLIHVIKRYMNIAGPGLKPELEILLLGLNTGNIQASLQEFESRISLPQVSRLVAILINTERGIDQRIALSFLSSDLRVAAREEKRRKLALRPAKMKRSMYPAILIAIFAIFYTFVISAFQNMRALF